MGPTRSLILKFLLSSAALAAALLLLAEIDGSRPASCDQFPEPSAPAANSFNLDDAFRDLIVMSYLADDDRALCVGPDSSSLTDDDRALCVGPDSSSLVVAMCRAGLSAVARSSAPACCGLPFDADSFDFALAASLDRVRVPARVILEMERVVRPGRVGVVLRVKPGSTGVRPEDLMKAVAPVTSLLRLSDVIGARVVNGSAMVLVVFKKRRGPVVVTSNAPTRYLECR